MNSPHEVATSTETSPKPFVVTVIGKGGSGKSTSVAAVGDVLARRSGRRTLLVDLDSQASLTFHLAGLDDRSTVDDVLAGDVALQEALRPIRDGLDLLPASNGLAILEPKLEPTLDLAQAIGWQDYGLVVIDTEASRPFAPGTAPLHWAAVQAADLVLLPFEPTGGSLHVVTETLQDLEGVTPAPVLLLPNRTGSTILEDAVRAELDGRLVLHGVRTTVRVAELPLLHGLLEDLAPSTTAAGDYREVVDELLPYLTLGGRA